MTKKEYKTLIEEYRNKNYELNKQIDKLDWELLQAKIKNDALVKAMTSEDTKMFIYNGETYSVRELNLTKTGDSLDVLELELVKVNTVVGYKGGLVGALNKAMENVTNSLKIALYGDKKE